MDMLGWSVALSGNTGLVGEFPQSGDQGGAYVFTRSGTTWRQQGGALTAGDGAANDWFGWSVALDGETALIGAWGHNGIQGAAYVVSPPTITPSVAAGKGTISPGAPQTASYGATPTFTFAPAAGYQVGTVSVDGGRVSLTGADRCTFPAVSADHTLERRVHRGAQACPAQGIAHRGPRWQRGDAHRQGVRRRPRRRRRDLRRQEGLEVRALVRHEDRGQGPCGNAQGQR